MRVYLPRNVNDEDLIREDPEFQRPRSEPTSMSYSLQRIRLAEICRSVADTMPLVMSDLEQVNYEDVVKLDGKFENFLVELPTFFRLDESSRQQSREIGRRFPQIAVQRYIISFMVHTRRCKLNQPFLIRGSVERPYTYSREACLRSARTVIQVKQLLEKEDIPFMASHRRLCAIIHLGFVAAIVLIMDLCFNKIVGQEEQQRAEVMNAINMLEDAKEQSAVASKFLNSLMDILRKYKIHLMNPTPADAHFVPTPAGYTSGSGDAKTNEEMPSRSTWIPSYQQECHNGESDFDETWQNYVEHGPNFDMPD